MQTNVKQTVLGSAPSSADYDVMQAVLTLVHMEAANKVLHREGRVYLI